MTRRHLFWALVAVALCVRLAFVVATPNYTPVHDDHDYDRLACAIVEGGGYLAVGPATSRAACGRPDAHPRPTAYRPPAYPAFLAAVYTVAKPLGLDRWTAARVVQALLGTLVAALIGLVAGRIWGERAGLAALGVAALHVPFAMVGASLVSETLFTAFEMAAVACGLTALRSPHPLRWIAAAGALVGLAWLTRSNGVLLLIPLGVAAWSALRGRGRRAATLGVVATCVAAALVVAPWTVRNEHALHGFVPVSTELGPTLIGTYNARSSGDGGDPAQWLLPRDVPSLPADLRGVRGEADRDGALTADAVSYAAGHPLYVVEVVERNLGRLVGAVPVAEWQRAGKGLDMPPEVGRLEVLWFWAVLTLAVVGVALGTARGAPRFFWIVPAVLLPSVVLVIAGVRFRMPIEPFVVIAAGTALARLAGYLPRRAAAT